LRVWHECCFHHLEEPIINLQRKRKKGWFSKWSQKQL
jgi:hypothetical protein